jgi:hypothetical protein
VVVGSVRKCSLVVLWGRGGGQGDRDCGGSVGVEGSSERGEAPESLKGWAS